MMPSKSDWILFSLILSLLFATSVFASMTGNLYLLFHDKTLVVYVADVKDSTQGHEVDAKLIKIKIEEALKKRKSITFQITQDPAGADILVDTEVKEFMWTDHDPVDMLMGAAASAYDLATVEDYARLQADMAVIEVKSKKQLWKDHTMATVTKKPMPRNESIPLVAEELAKVFVKNCFSKGRSKN